MIKIHVGGPPSIKLDIRCKVKGPAPKEDSGVPNIMGGRTVMPLLHLPVVNVSDGS